MDSYDLITNGMVKKLHNPSGPALRNLETQHVEFWYDGERIIDENSPHGKIIHDYNFTNKLLDMIGA